MLLISLIDIPEKMRLWSKWIDQGFPHQYPIICRAILGIIGILLALSPWIREWTRPKTLVALVPTSGPRPQMELRVTNEGSERVFYAECEPIDLRNSPNNLAKVVYSLKWESTNSKRLLLKTGESANLLVARANQDYKNGFAEMELLGLRGHEIARYEEARWNTNSREKLPEYDLKICIRGDGTGKPYQRVFTLRPKAVHGPLEMFELDSEVPGRWPTHLSSHPPELRK